MSGLVTGGTAVFRTDNQAGSVALLAVGSVASLLALVGKVPLRWVIGGNEFDMSEEEAAQQFVDVVASELSPEATVEFAERLARTEAGAQTPVAVAMLRHIAFEQATIQRVRQLVTTRGWEYLDAERSDRSYDGYVKMPNRPRIPVEYKLIPPGPGSFSRLAEVRRRQQQQPGEARVLVLSDIPSHPRTAEVLEDLVDLGVIPVSANEVFVLDFIAACQKVDELHDSETKDDQ